MKINKNTSSRLYHKTDLFQVPGRDQRGEVLAGPDVQEQEEGLHLSHPGLGHRLRRRDAHHPRPQQLGSGKVHFYLFACTKCSPTLP